MGVMVKEELCENMEEVRRVSDNVMAVVFVLKHVWNLICGHAPQNRKSLGEKQSFMIRGKVSGICSVDDLVLCLCNINGHQNRHFDGIGGVHGGY